MSEFVWADKPAGLTTHTSLNEVDRQKPWVDQNDGFMEWLEVRNGSRLFPVHRLDRETTGVLVFAKNKKAAESARRQFEDGQVQKEYLFITDRPLLDGRFNFTTESFIERSNGAYLSRNDQKPNSRTSFEFVRTEGPFSLWRARPETGKPHQIRLHASSAGIALLGDTLHGGSEFPTLCLHAHRLGFNSETRTSSPPIYFDNLSLLSDRLLTRWLAACDRRERATRSVSEAHESTTIRWIHSEGDPLRAERLGDVTSLNWFRDTSPTKDEWVSIRRLLEIKGWSTWYLQVRTDRGGNPQTDSRFSSQEPSPPEKWLATENGLRFEFRLESGLSPGLFLDQRRNREWIQRHARAQRVLNLFCYTGGFSVAAAVGGAKQVVSVDVSKTFIEWAKTNFELNKIGCEPHEFRAMDAGEYLAWAEKKGLSFETVICDPPSFARTNARGKTSVFRIEVEFDQLLTRCLRLTRPGGHVLFSLNFEKWSLDEFASQALRVLALSKTLKARIVARPSADLDFELPRAPRHMKSLVFEV